MLISTIKCRNNFRAYIVTSKLVGTSTELAFPFCPQGLDRLVGDGGDPQLGKTCLAINTETTLVSGVRVEVTTESFCPVSTR